MTFDLVQHVRNQEEWSAKTFGPGARTKGVIDHIRKELREIEKAPHDLEEWIDIVTLALDGAWRAGYTAEAVCGQLEQKLEKNKARTWPDWHTMSVDHAIEHVRES